MQEAVGKSTTQTGKALYHEFSRARMCPISNARRLIRLLTETPRAYDEVVASKESEGKMILRMVAIGCTVMVAAPGCTEVDREAQIQEFSRTCQIDYGFKAGTEQFSQCMMAMDQQARAESDQRRMAAAGAMQSMSNAYYNAANSYRPVNCTSSRGYGGMVNTTCY
ncbi:MAG: hypothetical protein LW715_00755 [Rhodobacter sp.]|jgi:hypothetical protein|nr:hypothetical protein [Rhodobacter sp.]